MIKNKLRELILLLSVIGLLSVNNLKANENEITLIFTSEYVCSWTPLEYIVVENVTQDAEITLDYPDTVLVLPFSTGIGDISGDYNDLYVSQNYPNPFSKKTHIDISIVEKDDLTITVYDITGRKLTSYNAELEPNVHNFTFYACNEQSYILKVTSKKHKEKQLMIQTGKTGEGISRIEYNGITSKTEKRQQTSKTELPFDKGDVLRFTGYIGDDYDEIVEKITEDKDYIFYILNTVPNAPIAVSATNIEYDGFTANWENVSGFEVTHYLLDVSTDSDFSSYIIEQEDIGDDTDYEVTDLDPGTEYHYRVYAVNECGTSDASNVIDVETICPEPDVPSATNATNIEEHAFTANWEEVTSYPAVTHYLLDVSTNINFSSFVADYEQKNVGNNTSDLVTDLDPSTEYYYRVFAVNSCGTSDASDVIEVETEEIELPLKCSPCNGITEVSCIYSGETYGVVEVEYTVEGITQNCCWLDRNLGASNDCDNYDDYECYGDLFQWGRLADGHQLINWTCGDADNCGTPEHGTTTTLATSDNPGHNEFITNSNPNFDWLGNDHQNNNLWKTDNGTIQNNPCPAGWRVPTEDEWQAELDTWDWSESGDTPITEALASALKLPVAGNRSGTNGSFNNVGSFGDYWSSNADGNNSLALFFRSNIAGMGAGYFRASGRSVRCIKDDPN